MDALVQTSHRSLGVLCTSQMLLTPLSLRTRGKGINVQFVHNGGEINVQFVHNSGEKDILMQHTPLLIIQQIKMKFLRILYYPLVNNNCFAASARLGLGLVKVGIHFRIQVELKLSASLFSLMKRGGTFFWLYWKAFTSCIHVLAGLFTVSFSMESKLRTVGIPVNCCLTNREIGFSQFRHSSVGESPPTVVSQYHTHVYIFILRAKYMRSPTRLMLLDWMGCQRF